MATLSALYPTLADFVKSTNPDQSIAQIIGLLNQTNEVIDDMVWKEGNLPTGHRATIQTGLPTATFRKLNGGVMPSKGRTAQIDFSCAMLEQFLKVDVDLAKLNGNSAAFMMTQAAAHLEAMSQKFSSTLFYGNESTTPEEFTGLSNFYNDQNAESGCNILTNVATPDATDNASMWLICWGDNIHGIYPKGSVAGLQRKDMGEQLVQNSDGSMYKALVDHFKWDCGLAVNDWRYAVRINIDAEDLTKNASSGPDLLDLMAQAVDLIPNIGAGRPVFYANRTVRGFLRRQITNKIAASTLSLEQITRPNGAYQHVPMFDGIPVKRCDALLNTEAGL